jgi:hypothetical protein
MATTTDQWSPAAAGDKFNMPTGSGAKASTTELNAISSPVAGADAETKLWHPSNPLFWLGGIMAVTFGLAAVSTTVRVGPASVSGKLGKA